MSPKKKTKTKPKPLDIKLTLENFGPLRKAEIDLKPMTIFIGPNNSGKSYAAMMFYSLFNSDWRADLGSRNFQWFMQHLPCREELGKVLDRDGSLLENNTPNVGKENMRKVAQSVFEGLSLNAFFEEITGCFGATLGELRRKPRRGFTARIGFGSSTISLKANEKNIEVSEFQPGDYEIGDSFPITLPFFGPSLMSDKVLRREGELAALAQSIALHALEPLYSKVVQRCFYLPAPRCGLMQTHRPFTEATLQQMNYTPSGRASLSTLTKPISDFLKITGTFPRFELGPLVDLERAMTLEMIDGYVGAERFNNQPRPHFWYQLLDERKMELYRASSTVSELAPLLLYLRYLIAPGDVLIIDEPEAHLHPENQRILAKYLVRLVREGVNLIITTHSDYLFGHINNYILWGKVREKRLKEKSSDLPEDYLNPEEVGAYLFKRDKRIKTGVAYRTEALHCREKMTEDGLPEEMFIEANDDLYEDLSDARIALAKE